MNNMNSTIGLVTDSSSQITPALVSRYGVEVVPLLVTIDGVEFSEGVDLDADGFYEHFADGAVPDITTSQPAPGRFVEAYQHLAARGCTEIVSIHISEAMSGTISAARIAAGMIDVPVEVIDTASASFGVSVCVWSAGETLRRGGTAHDVGRRITDLVPRIGTAFMAGVPMLTQRGGRAAQIDVAPDDADGITVLSMSDGKLDVLGRVTTVEQSVQAMTSYVAGWGDSVTVAIGVADSACHDLNAALRVEVGALATVDEVIEYRVGPSVGAHTGPGTIGLFVFPTLT